MPEAHGLSGSRLGLAAYAQLTLTTLSPPCALHAAQLAAKCETRQALFNIQTIAAAADCLIMSRGNLGLDVLPEKMALVQKAMINNCTVIGKPILITRVVDTMVNAPRPTRCTDPSSTTPCVSGLSPCPTLVPPFQQWTCAGDAAGGERPGAGCLGLYCNNHRGCSAWIQARKPPACRCFESQKSQQHPACCAMLFATWLVQQGMHMQWCLQGVLSLQPGPSQRAAIWQHAMHLRCGVPMQG